MARSRGRRSHSADALCGFALGAVALVYALGATLFGREHGLLAALLLGTNPFFLEWARNGRGYTLAILGVTASTYLFVRALREPSWLRWLAYSLVSGAVVYTHFFAALVLLAHAFALPWVASPSTRGRAGVALAGSALLTSPLLVFVLTSDHGQIDWIAKPSAFALIGLLYDFAGRSAGLFLLLPLIAALSALGARSVLSVGDERRHGEFRWRIPLVVGWLAAPATLSFAASFVKPVFFSRYLILSLPAFVVLVALGVLLPRARLVSMSLTAAIVAASLAQVGDLYATGGRDHEDWRGATEYVLESSRSEDGIVFYRSYVEVAFGYYARRLDRSTDRPEPLYRYRGYGFTGRRVPASWDPLRKARHRRIWLVLSHNRRKPVETQLIRDLLRVRYDLVEVRTFDKIRVELYARSATTAGARR